MLQRQSTPNLAGRELFKDSTFIWSQADTTTRNQFVSFQKEIEWSCLSGECWLHVFADTRYRLYLNEVFVAYGPGRFVTQYPEYDSFELGRLMEDGLNRVRVEVNYYGSSSYQSMPDGKPGFIAAGGSEDGQVDFSTPGNWKFVAHKAWDPQAALFSFAQNPAEICDTRVLAEELSGPFASKPATLSGEACPWGALRPRSTGYPEYTPMRPQRVNVAGPLKEGKKLLAIQTTDPDFLAGKSRGRHSRRMLSWIHAPKAHAFELDCLWVDLELNGVPLERHGSTPFGNHEVATLPLRQGWNLLTARFEVLTEHWTVLLGYPVDENISWHARPDRSETLPFLVSGLERGDNGLPRFAEPEDFIAPDDWTEHCGSPNLATPARQVAWDEFDESATIRDLGIASFSEISCIKSKSASWCFHFGDEYYGHPVLDVDAPEGTILDIAYDDWQREDGATNLYSSNPFTDAADRFILRGGRQRIEVCNPRGGIFLQVTLRAPDGKADLTLYDVVVRSRRTLAGETDRFDCDNPVFNWAWEKSLHTLKASTDEGYADCPWRERGSYIGDSLVNLHIHPLLTTDLSVGRRVMRIFGEAQLANGQLAPVAPAWHRRPHEDFTLIWLQCLRDYWAISGDKSLLEEMWPRVERLWASPVWKEGSSGLWDAVGLNVFIDWGRLASETEGEANAVLNLFRLEGIRSTATIARVLGRSDEANLYLSKAERLRQAIEKTLWNEAEGRLMPSLGASTPAVHANVLALLYGVGDSNRLMAYLGPLLKRNFRYGIEKGQGTGYIEMYFLIFLLPALAKHGRHDLAEAIIEEHYAFLQGLGYPTLNECFSRAHRNTGSCCHSWSGAAAVYLARHVLGLRQLEPGDPDRWILDPVTVSINRASGTIPHSKGDIHVAWKRKGNRFVAKVRIPDGVSVTPGDTVDLS